jgi:hypothetical protein
MYFIAQPTTLTNRGFFDDARGFRRRICMDRELTMTHKNTEDSHTIITI